MGEGGFFFMRQRYADESIHPDLRRTMSCIEICLGIALLLYGVPARADVKLPAIFGDHMVLQEQATLPVWGWARPGEIITVTFGLESVQATAGSDGKWRADLPALPAGSAPGSLVVAGQNKVTFQDVLVGEVWLCSGQSNMELPLAKAADGKAAVAAANDNGIRLCRVPWDMAIAPREDVRTQLADGDLWQVCTPQNVGAFSAVGYFFGHDLRARLKWPVGLIESCWGGTPCQAWTDLKTLRSDPGLQHHANALEKFTADFPGGDTEFMQKLTADLKPGQRPAPATSAADTARICRRHFSTP